MTKITYPSIARNFPEFVREEYPLFVKLVEEYYKFLDTTYAGDLDSIKDIDNTPDLFIEYFRKQYTINISTFWNLDFKEFLYFAKSFYSSRGSEDSIRFLFRAMFGEEIEIDYPGKYVLRASDGKWHQDYHIELKTLHGTFPQEGVPLHFENPKGIFVVAPSRIEIIPETDKCLVFFEQPYKVFVEPDQKFTQKNDSDEITYIGQCLPSSSKLLIENPGKYWQVGAVIVIPGTAKDTFARVTKVNSVGAISAIEILEYGYEHEDNQALIISPFPNRPIGSVVDINSEIISASPLAYHYTIDIHDYTDGCTETLKGTSSRQDFFIEQFFDTDFFGASVINKTWMSPIPALGEGETVTIEQWLESRATIVFGKELIVRDRGYYLNSDSLISNKEIRLHDSFYYQAFSYVVETERELSSYRDSLSLTHPAGMKFFSLMNKEVVLPLTPEITNIFGTDQVNMIEILAAIDHSIKLFGKKLVDSVVTSHPVPELSVVKPRFDSVISSDAIADKFFGKIVRESINTPDSIFSVVTKPRADSVTTPDSSSLDVVKPFYENLDSIDTVNKLTSKELVDSVTIPIESSHTVSSESYISIDFFSEIYFTPQRKLEIQ